MRVASVVLLPDTLRDALAQALPGFGSGTAAAAGAKVIAFPGVAKLAAVAVVVTGGGVTVAETVQRDTSRPAVGQVAPTDDSAKTDAVAVPDSRRHATSKPSSHAKRASQRQVAVHRGKPHDTRTDQRESDMRENEEEAVRQRHEDDAAEPEDDDTQDEDEDSEDEDSEDEADARVEPVTADPEPGDDVSPAEVDGVDTEGSDAGDTLDD